MALDLPALGHILISNPVGAGIVAKFLTDAIKQFLKKTDESGELVSRKGLVQPVVYVLTVLTAVLGAGMEGNAASVDPAPVVSFALQMLLSAFGTNEVVKGAKQATVAVKDKVIGAK